ncbi:MAG: SBBP repeat-containing protein, partial [Cryomorphaceae bacterium]
MKNLSTLLLPVLTVLLMCIAGSASARSADNPGEQQGFLKNEGRILNQNGLVNNEVLYMWSAGNGINVQVRESGFSYDTYSPAGQNGTAQFHRVDVNLINTSASASIIPMEQAEAHINIYDPRHPERNASGLRPYGKIIYQGIYPGIDMELSLTEVEGKKQFKYDFIAAPGADTDLIEVEYLGFNQAEVNGDEIVFELSTGTLRESIPMSFLSPGGETIDVNYRNIAGHDGALRVGMALPEGRSLPADKSLTIDPTAVLEWGTYYGGEANDVNNSIAVDSLGFLFVAGTTNSVTGMASEGSHQGEFSGVNSDAFIARFNQHGLRQWATYYGGSGDDEGLAVALSSFQHVYLAGKTTSADSIGTEGAYLTENAGDSDGFLARFDRFGALIWDTFLGGDDHDEITACYAADNGTIFIAGNTQSVFFATPQDSIPITLSGNYAGGTDAFVGRFDQDGNFQGGRYFGG